MTSKAAVLLCVVLCALLHVTSAFTISPSFVPSSRLQSETLMTRANSGTLRLNARGSKGGTKRDDLSSIETRDMTRQEMLDYNKESEDIMNSELQVRRCREGYGGRWW
jgi:hypothetical protein